MFREHLWILYPLVSKHDQREKSNTTLYTNHANSLVIWKFSFKYSCYAKWHSNVIYFPCHIWDEFFAFLNQRLFFSNPFHFENVQTIDYYSFLSFLNFSSRWIYRNDSSFPLEKKNWVFCDSDISALHHDGHSLPSIFLA